MPRSRSSVERSASVTSAHLAVIGRLTTRVGIGAVVTAAPLSLATFLALLLDAPTVAAGVDAAIVATSGPLAASGGVEWYLHVGVLGLLVGCWLVGAGLVLSELTD